MRLLSPLILVLCLAPGCIYKAGGGLTAGMMDEIAGNGRTEGLEGVITDLTEQQVFAELGHQLGSSLVSGATDITPEQQARLELAIEGALHVAAARTGAGLRDEVSPQLREMVQQDIVETLAAGMRGELGDSLQETVERVVAAAVHSLEESLKDPLFREAVSDTIRESTYHAMREGKPGMPGVGETLEVTLSENLLAPMETSVGGMVTNVADRVDASAKRTERTLQGVISALVVVLGVFLLMYLLTRRQLQRTRATVQVTQQELRTVGAALDHLDPQERARILGKLDEYHQVAGRAPKAPQQPGRSDDYVRKDE